MNRAIVLAILVAISMLQIPNAAADPGDEPQSLCGTPEECIDQIDPGPNDGCFEIWGDPCGEVIQDFVDYPMECVNGETSPSDGTSAVCNEVAGCTGLESGTVCGDVYGEADACVSGATPAIPCDTGSIGAGGSPFGPCEVSRITQSFNVPTPEFDAQTPVQAYLMECEYKVTSPPANNTITLPGFEVNSQPICLLGVTKEVVTPLLADNGPRLEDTIPVSLTVGMCRSTLYATAYGFDVLSGPLVPCIE